VFGAVGCYKAGMRWFSFLWVLGLVLGCTTVPIAPPPPPAPTPTPFGLWGATTELHPLRPGLDVATTAFLRIEPGVVTRLTECSVSGQKEIVGATSASDIGAQAILIHHDRESDPKPLLAEGMTFACVAHLESGRQEFELSPDGQTLYWKDKEGNASEEFTHLLAE
jgi:hypothetical protein